MQQLPCINNCQIKLPAQYCRDIPFVYSDLEDTPN